MVIKNYFQYITPFLLVTLCILSVSSWTGITQRKWYKVTVLLVSAGLTFIPFAGLSLAEYLLSLNPSFSIGSLTLITWLLIPYFTHLHLGEEKHLIVFCVWNVGLSLGLFSSYLGLVPFDLYPLGYDFSWWFVVMATVTLATVWWGSPLSLILLAYIAAFNLDLLPSGNFFDYLTDGVLFVLSLMVLAAHTLKGRRARVQWAKAAA